MFITKDGRIWTLGNWGKQTSPAQYETRTWVSAGGGVNWKLATRTRIQCSAHASMVVDLDGTTLHLACSGRVDLDAR